jgi:hypothetical protein
MIRFGIIGFHLGNDTAPLPQEARIGVSPKADVIEVCNAAGAFLATVSTLVSVYFIVFDEVLPVVWVVIVALCWLFGVTMQIIVRLMTLGRRKTSRDCHTMDGWHRRRRINLLEAMPNLASRVVWRMRSVV